MFNLFRRRRGGISVLLLLAAVCGLVSSCMAMVFGVPTSIARSREVSNLPIIAAGEVEGLTGGTKGLFAAQIPANAPADEVNGLALYYIEERQRGTPTAAQKDSNQTNSTFWERTQPAPDSFELTMSNGQPLMVTLPSSVTFRAAETVAETAAEDDVERRAVGYRAGQTLTIEGRWEGKGLVTAQTLYYGTPEEYVADVGNDPGSIFLFSVICGGLSLGLLVVGGVMRFLGR